MPIFSGPLKKLSSIFNEPVEYFLPIGDQKICLNELLDTKITLRFLKKIFCIQCGRQTAKSFQQGYCYPCFTKLMNCNLCIIHPEKCNYPHHECPDSWEHEHCKQTHIVYLANSSSLKVGITRDSQIPTRWIDQGASQAVTLFKVSNRYQSGLLEVLFKQFIADKTNWRKMLSEGLETMDMVKVKEELLKTTESKWQFLLSEQKGIQLLENAAVNLTYPIKSYPNQLKAMSFDKQEEISGTLCGIKGQYLLFEQGVINIRKHSGYHVSLAF